MPFSPDIPLTDAEVQDLFDYAGDIDSPAAAALYYRDWAPVYDQTISRLGAYLSPDLLAGMAAQACPDRSIPVLDLACGTGLLGAALARQGFAGITGLDLSPEMLAQAKAKQCYRRLVTGDLTQDWPFPAGAFGLITCAGAFMTGHLGVEVLLRAARALPKGGVLLVDVEAGSFEDGGYAAALEGLAGAEVWRAAAHLYSAPEGEPPHGWLVRVRV